MDQKETMSRKKVQDSQTIVRTKPRYAAVILIGAVVGIFTSLLTVGAIEGVKFVLNQSSEQQVALFESAPVTEKSITLKEESATVDAAKKVRPSVVSIVATRELETYYQSGDLGNSSDPFDYFFDAPRIEPDGGTQTQRVGGGTGFFITEDGLILTNKHVVDNSGLDYTVVDFEGNEFPAQVLAKDPVQDIAVLKIEGNDFPTVELGDSENLDPGQTVIAIGNSLGEYSNTVTKGVVSGTGRSITAGSAGAATTIDNVIQTDAAINPGNSGGPLVNIEGQVIGINTAIDVSGQLIGFAIPINDAKIVVDQVSETGKISRPYVGIRYTPITSEIAKQNDLAYDYGILVSRGPSRADLAVIPGGPADKAGIEENDIILEVNGVKLDRTVNFSREVLKYQVGEEVSIKVFKDGEERDLPLILEERGD
jgi:S1-C subfamily serine protease